MADWDVHVTNDEVSVYDTSSHATLEEIRDLLKQLLARFPAPCHPDPTGKTREPPHCPTCDCGHQS